MQITNVISLITSFDKQANVNICKNCKYAKCIKLTNQSLIVKTKDTTNILTEKILFLYILLNKKK